MADFYLADQSYGSRYNSSGSYIDPYSKEAYLAQKANFGKYAGMFETGYGKVSPYAEAAMKYFAPGGGYGQGQKIQATKAIQRGVARDTIAAVNAGMSSNVLARGLQTRAAGEKATQFRNIEDSRAQLGMQANDKYTNMLNSLSWLATGAPKYNPTVLNASSGSSNQQASSTRTPQSTQQAGGQSQGGGGIYQMSGKTDTSNYEIPLSQSLAEMDAYSNSFNNDDSSYYHDDTAYLPEYVAPSQDVNYYDPYADDYVDEGYYDAYSNSFLDYSTPGSGDIFSDIDEWWNY